MHEQIQIIAHMQMAQLQRPRQRNNKRRVHGTLRAQRALLATLIRHPVFVFEHAGWQGFRGDAARERRVVVDVEFEQVEEFVRYEVDGAVDVFFYAEEEL